MKEIDFKHYKSANIAISMVAFTLYAHIRVLRHILLLFEKLIKFYPFLIYHCESIQFRCNFATKLLNLIDIGFTKDHFQERKMPIAELILFSAFQNSSGTKFKGFFLSSFRGNGSRKLYRISDLIDYQICFAACKPFFEFLTFF